MIDLQHMFIVVEEGIKLVIISNKKRFLRYSYNNFKTKYKLNKQKMLRKKYLTVYHFFKTIIVNTDYETY